MSQIDLKLEDIKKITKSYKFKYVAISENSEINKILKTINENLLNLSAIPNILNPKAKYKTFTISCPDKFDEGDKIILLKENYSEKEIELTLNYNYFSLSDILKEYEIPRIASFQQIGHIVHVNLLTEHQPFKKILGQLILDKTRCAKSVITKTNNVGGVYRTFNFEILAGSDDLRTIHIENQIRYFIDYRNVYWNGKLSKERLSLVMNNKSKGRYLADCTCGVGALSLLALKHGYRVYANDLNPDAIQCAKRSIELNKKLNESEIKFYNLDSNCFIEKLINEKDIKIDHFVFNLPEKSLELLKPLANIKNKYTIHAYFFCKETEDCVEYAKNKVWFDLDKNDIKYTRNVSPNKNMYKLTKTINA